MPHLTLSRAQEGWVTPLTVGVNGATTASLVAAGQPVPPPQTIRAQLDTGTNITGLSAAVLSLLGLRPLARHTTQTLSGSVPIELFEISLSIPHTGRPSGPPLVLDQLIVMALPTALAGIDALIGQDVSDQLLLILDGPPGELTVCD